MTRAYEATKVILGKLGLLPAARWLRELFDVDLHRRKRMHRRGYLEFKRKYREYLGHNLQNPDVEPKVALVSSILFPEVHIELAIIKALQLANFEPVVLMPQTSWLLPKYYELAGVKRIFPWKKFTGSPNLAEAEAVLKQFRSIEELLTFEYEGARVGRHAISTAFRIHKLGSFDLKLADHRRMLAEQIARGMEYAKAAKRMLEKFEPDLFVCTDKGYSPKGELFDNCLSSGIDSVSWDIGHRSNSLLLKRFTFENRDQHNTTLSPELWELVRNLNWSDAYAEQLNAERLDCYATGEWYSVAGTQVNKRFMDPDEIRQNLGLDPRKKTAVIFPHILWDATLFWGKSLYPNYEDWLIETVRAACKNDQVNWVIKIHPAHIGKGLREGFKVEPAEAKALAKHIGQLPPHVFMIPAESSMSTYSLFELMDYCITVRGSVGIEAAMLGIPVLTAGEGCYDNKGFTIDSESREEYLEKVSRIHTIPRLSPTEQELAQRFAYGYFILRILRLTTVDIQYHKSQERHLAVGHVNISDKDEWSYRTDIKEIADWMTRSGGREFWHHPHPPDPSDTIKQRILIRQP